MHRILLAGLRMTCNPESLEKRVEFYCLERLNTWLGSGKSDERMETTISLLKMGRKGPFHMPYYESVGVYMNGRESTSRGNRLFSLNGLLVFALIYISIIFSMIRQWVFCVIG